MKRVAVVDDMQVDVEHLKDCLYKFSDESGERFEVETFKDGHSFLTEYKSRKFDVVFMDIEMPGIDGMSVAAHLRKLDESVLLVFITQMAQYAIKGYEVNAFDYIVKPYGYKTFALRMKKIIANLNGRTGAMLKLAYNGNVKVLDSAQVLYIEVTGHDLAYHTTGGVFKAYGSLKDVEKSCPPSFKRCNSCYLVNLRHVTEVKGFELYIGDEKLQISQPKRKEFMQALTDYLGSTL